MARPTQESVKQSRIPLVGNPDNRIGNVTTKDQRFYNCLTETFESPIIGEKKVFLIKRPGYTTSRTFPAGNGRGFTYWQGNTYSAIGSKLYKAGIEIGGNLLTGTSGHVGMEVCTTNDFGDCLFVADGTNCYIIKSDGSYLLIPQVFPNRSNSTGYSYGQYVIPAVPNGYYYRCVIAGTSAAAPIIFPTYIDAQVTDGSVTWQCSGYYGFSYGVWLATTSYSQGKQVVPTVSNGFVYEATVAGITGVVQPNFPQAVNATVIDGTVTWTCVSTTSTSTPLPSNTLPYPIYMDGYIFLIAKKQDGSNSSAIYNSDTDNPLSWNQVDFVNAESFPDNLVALARQNNILLAFGDYTIEMFNDAGNASGSPITRNESMMLQFGCASPKAIMQEEAFVTLVGQSNTGGRAVWLIDGFRPNKVSTPYIEKILDNEGTNLVNATGFGIRTTGHLIYVLRLSTRTLVYDITEKMWTEWSDNAGGNTHSNFPFAFATDIGDGNNTLLGATNGLIVSLNPTVYQDNGVTILMDIYTQKLDFETMNRKTMTSMYLIGDVIPPETALVSWSDDDYTTYNNPRVLAMPPDKRAYLSNLGQFRRRSFRILVNGPAFARILAVEFEISMGVN